MGRDGEVGVQLDNSSGGGVSQLEVIEGPSGRRRRRGAADAGDPGGAGGVVVMLAQGGPVKVFVATRPVDFRKGTDGLAMAAQEMFGLDPFSGAVFVFRSKRADRIKLLVWDQTGSKRPACPLCRECCVEDSCHIPRDCRPAS